MPATSPRITISLDPADHETLRRLADLQGVPMSRIVREFVREVGPILHQLADTLEAAQKAEASASIRFRQAAEEAERDLAPLAAMIRNQFDLFADEVQGKLGASDEDEAPTDQARKSA
jgi:hypothetical protein